MKLRPIPAILAIVASLLLPCLFAGSAVAAGAKLCSKNETPCTSDYASGTEVKLSLATGTKLKKSFGNPGEEEVLQECSGSTMSGSTTTTGGPTTPVEATLNSLTFSSCTTCSITVLTRGRFVIESIPGTMNGKVRWTGFEIKESCGVFGECVFGSEATKGIFLRGGSEAALKFEEATIPKKSGSGAFCSVGMKWTGTFTITAPKPLYVSGSTSESFSGAGVLCKEEAEPCSSFFYLNPTYGSGTTVSAKLKAGIISVIEAGFPTVECEESSMSGEVQDPGSSTEPIVGVWTSWTFGGCNCKVTVPSAGNFSIDWTSAGNGSLVLSGFEIATNCGGKSCNFGSSIKEGVALNGGNPAVVKATKAPVPKQSGIAECKSTSEWSAEYEVTAPQPVYVAEK